MFEEDIFTARFQDEISDSLETAALRVDDAIKMMVSSFDGLASSAKALALPTLPHAVASDAMTDSIFVAADAIVDAIRDSTATLSTRSMRATPGAGVPAAGAVDILLDELTTVVRDGFSQVSALLINLLRVTDTTGSATIDAITNIPAAPAGEAPAAPPIAQPAAAASTGNMFKDIFSMLGKTIMGSLVAPFLNIFSSIIGPAQILGNLLGPLLEILSDTVLAVLYPFQAVFTTLAQTLAPILIKLQPVLQLVAGAVTMLIEPLGLVIGQIVDFITAITGTEQMTRAATSSTEAYNAAIRDTSTVAQESIYTWDEYRKQFRDLFLSLKQVFDFAADTIGSTVVDIVRAIVDPVGLFREKSEQLGLAWKDLLASFGRNADSAASHKSTYEATMSIVDALGIKVNRLKGAWDRLMGVGEEEEKGVVFTGEFAGESLARSKGKWDAVRHEWYLTPDMLIGGTNAAPAVAPIAAPIVTPIASAPPEQRAALRETATAVADTQSTGHESLSLLQRIIDALEYGFAHTVDALPSSLERDMLVEVRL